MNQALLAIVHIVAGCCLISSGGITKMIEQRPPLRYITAPLPIPAHTQLRQ